MLLAQAGDKMKAMKCLLKSQDTEKICYYAQVTKKKVENEDQDQNQD